jgi:hypothetical protein
MVENTNNNDGGAGGVKPWYDGQITDPDTIGHIQARGWDKGDAKEVAANAIKAHREAQQMLSTPQDRIIRLPSDANDKAGWSGVYQRLGAPKDVKEYDTALGNVKFADGTGVDQPVIDMVKARAAEAGWKVETAEAVLKDLVNYVENGNKALAVQAQAAQKGEQEKLVTKWGSSNVDGFLVVAKNTAAKLGVTPEGVVALERSVGYADAMDLFYRIGKQMGEANFIAGQGGNGSQVMSKEQAAARLKDLKNDSDFQKRFLSGNVDAVKEFNAVTAIAAAD